LINHRYFENSTSIYKIEQTYKFPSKPQVEQQSSDANEINDTNGTNTNDTSDGDEWHEEKLLPPPSTLHPTPPDNDADTQETLLDSPKPRRGSKIMQFLF
jgi:hypothetical protein